MIYSCHLFWSSDCSRFPSGSSFRPASLLCVLIVIISSSLLFWNNKIFGLLFCFPAPAVESDASQYETWDSFFSPHTLSFSPATPFLSFCLLASWLRRTPNLHVLIESVSFICRCNGASQNTPCHCSSLRVLEAEKSEDIIPWASCPTQKGARNAHDSP